MVLGSKFYTQFKKDVSSDLRKSHQLLLKAGLVYQIENGIFAFLPLGLRILKNIQSIIAKHHTNMGFNEILLPNMQPANIWIEGGRYESYGDEMMSLKGRKNKEYILGPTSELICAEVINFIGDKNQLPINLFNIQSKFRDEISPRNGMIRTKEFIMSDGYSFNLCCKKHTNFYNNTRNKYMEMFNELGVEVMCSVQENTGEIGGDSSYEFFAKSISGEHIEVAHIFNLGKQYLSYKNLDFDIYMGCYGVGVSRLISVYAETHITNTDNVDHIKWPKSVAPFKIYLVGSERAREICHEVHEIDQENIYYRDQNEEIGQKLAIGRLIGAEHTLIIGDKELDNEKALLDGVEIPIKDILSRTSSIML